ncbi:MAG: hypothetical protein L0Z62_18695 [Gemmataceae bacterium]|nr:hypothetical protein [Gemmataceae bacterium]
MNFPARKATDFASLAQQALGEVHPLLHIAQFASQVPDLVPKRRDLGLGSLVDHAGTQPASSSRVRASF